jgi:hypothetical protein
MWDLWTKWHWGRFSPNTSVPLPILIPLTARDSSSSITWGWYNRPISGQLPSGLSLNLLKEEEEEEEKNLY